MAGSSKMAADGGSVFWVGRPLTTPKRMAGSSKMAADGGSVFWVGTPLTTPKRMAGATEKEETRMMQAR